MGSINIDFVRSSTQVSEFNCLLLKPLYCRSEVLSIDKEKISMRVALMAGANAIHTIRWANGLAAAGLDVHLLTAHPLCHKLDAKVHLHQLPFRAPWGYLLNVVAVRRLLESIKPDLLNPHYATGYGTLARLSGFRPLVLSVWGSDVYDFPRKSNVHRRLLAANILAADVIGSTSFCMARVTKAVQVHNKVHITPFGIDENLFHPFEVEGRSSDELVIGTIKTLGPKYGVDTLIEAFAIAWDQLGCPDNLYLEISGGGPQRSELEELVVRLGVSERVRFFGPVPHERVPEMLNRLDVYVALSRVESFGVAILEACACAKPVLVSDADGPAEVTVDGETGLIVERDSPNAAAEALVKLIEEPAMRTRMGAAGRLHVIEHYTWENSVRQMLAAYEAAMALPATDNRAAI